MFVYLSKQTNTNQTDKQMYNIYAIKDNKVINTSEAIEADFLENAKAIVHAITECDTITVLRTTGAFVSQESMKPIN
jgi:hypothetical protein